MVKTVLKTCKLSIIIMANLTIWIHLSSAAVAEIHFQVPRVTITADNILLEEVFSKIHHQTGLTIHNDFKETALNEKKKVSVNFLNATINDVMTFLLSDKKDLGYTLNKNSILIFKQAILSTPKLLSAYILDTLSKEIDFTGKIIDKDGNPVPGASIKIKGSTHGTISNSDGSFRISDINRGSIAIITSIGFESKEVLVDKKSVLIQLNSHTNLLDEKVIMAYGTTTKRLNTGNIGSLKAKDIQNQLVGNPLSALQGRIPGIFIEQSSGVSGSGVTVRIQGLNSLLSGSDPFYIIDGVPYISQLLPTQNTIGGSSGANGVYGNPLNYMNPADIESIEVLKDADATAIYGSRAANGAILITTKRGKAGPVNVNVLFQSGWANVSRKLPVLNTKDYLEMRHEALKNDGSTVSSFDWDLNGTWDTTRNANWQKELIGKTANYTDAQVSTSGGNAYTQFLFGVGYHKETTVFPGPFSDQKANVHLNLNSNSLNQKFKLQFTSSFSFDDNRLPTTDLTSSALTLAPMAPNPYSPDGSINWAPDQSGASTYYNNPIAAIAQRSRNKTMSLVNNAVISYEIIPGLTIKSNVGYNNLVTNEITKVPISIVAPEYRQYSYNTTTFLTNRIISWTIEPQLEYTRKIKKGNLNVLLGSTLTQLNSDQQLIIASGFSNELVMEDLASATRITGQSINSIYKYNALYGRVTYNLLEKYIINLSGRRDGSSRFGTENQFHNFGAIGAAWIFSQEQLIQSNLPSLSFGKLRGSFGTTGNDQIGDYQFIDIYQPMLITGNPYQNITGLTPSRLTNPALAWEETKKLQFGLELGFINNRIFYTVNYNLNRSGNQLIMVNLPYISGFGSITKNFPAVIQNTGWEMTLATTNIKTKNFSWSTNVNITIPKNQLLSYSGKDKSTMIFLGKSLSSQIYYNYAGVNETTGQYQFKDVKGNLTSSPSDPVDKTIVANTDSKFYGGLQNSFSYKNFSLDIFFSFTKRSAINNISYGLNGNYPGMFNSGLANQSTSVLNRWQKPGDKAEVQPYSAGLNTNLTYITNSSVGLTDGSYIRLKNIALSWQFPDAWKKALHTSAARLFLNAQNVLTITKYKGLDPETKSALPPLRIVTIGAQITL